MPLAYLTGEQEFWGLALSVDERVLVPRPDTEILVERALECLQRPQPIRYADLIALDLGTGSGAIALAMAHERPRRAHSRLRCQHRLSGCRRSQ